jgi:hypothetical protein
MIHGTVHRLAAVEGPEHQAMVQGNLDRPKEQTPMWQGVRNGPPDRPLATYQKITVWPLNLRSGPVLVD